MRRAAIAIGVLSLVACHRSPEAAHQAEGAHEPSKLTIERLRKEEPGITDLCLKAFQNGATSSPPDEKCFKFGPAERMSGTWAAMFEGSQFCPGRARTCEPLKDKPSIWLDFSEQSKTGMTQYIGGIYDIDFVGRRTMYPGHYGEYGMFDEEVLVDRVLTIRQIKAPPPPLTEAQIKQLDKQCEAAPNCLTPREMQALRQGKK